MRGLLISFRLHESYAEPLKAAALDFETSIHGLAKMALMRELHWGDLSRDVEDLRYEVRSLDEEVRSVLRDLVSVTQLAKLGKESRLRPTAASGMSKRAPGGARKGKEG